jgi:tetratricopeptide (TPR) repeat protein
MPHPVQVARPARVLVLVLLALAALIAVSSADAKAKGKPNLIVSTISEAPASLSEGTKFTAVEGVRNSGRGGAGKSTVRYYLTTDAARSLRERKASRTNPRTSPSDILLTGVREVGELRAGGSSVSRKVSLEVPLGTPSGSYQLLACADDRGTVDETREDDNCRAAKKQRPVTSGGATRIDAFSDSAFPPDEEAIALQVGLLRTMYCTAPPKAKAFSLKTALASLKKKLPRAGWSAFAKSPSYKKAALAERAAGAAILRDSPGAALAALVRAHELEPREASHLINAAGVANSVGMPGEALALADAGAARDDTDIAPMGIARQAVALTNRGNALAQLGRFKEAGQSLSAAQGIEPLLSEAASGLAVAQACTGQDPVPAFRRSIKRQPEKGPLPPPEDEPPADTDEKHGKETKLREIQWPALPINNPGFHDYIKGFDERESGVLLRRINRDRELRDQLAADQIHPLHRERREALISYAHIAVDTPKRKELQKAFFAAVDRTHEPVKMFVDGNAPTEYSRWQDDAGQVCIDSEEDWDPCMAREMRSRCVGPTNSRHQQWLDYMTEAERLGRELVKEESLRASAVAANLKDPRAREVVELFIEGQEQSTLALLTQSARHWSGNVIAPRGSDGVYWCINTPMPPSGSADPGAADAPGNNPCEGDVKSINLLWSIGPVTLKASCEELALEGSTEGFFQAFGEIKYDYRGNKITVFGGAKAELGVPGLKGDFKSGVYVQVGQDGLQDVGWRVGPSYTVGGGVAEFNPSDTIDMSFIGALGGGG